MCLSVLESSLWNVLKSFTPQQTTLLCDVGHGKLLPLPSCRTPRPSRGIAGNVLGSTTAQERIFNCLLEAFFIHRKGVPCPFRKKFMHLEHNTFCEKSEESGIAGSLMQPARTVSDTSFVSLSDTLTVHQKTSRKSTLCSSLNVR